MGRSPSQHNINLQYLKLEQISMPSSCAWLTVASAAAAVMRSMLAGLAVPARLALALHTPRRLGRGRRESRRPRRHDVRTLVVESCACCRLAGCCWLGTCKCCCCGAINRQSSARGQDSGGRSSRSRQAPPAFYDDDDTPSRFPTLLHRRRALPGALPGRSRGA